MLHKTAWTMATLAFLSLVAPTGCNKPATADSNTSSAQAAPAAGRSVAITANEDGFKPSEVTVKKGEKTTLVFTRTTDGTCAKNVVFPDIKIDKELPLNKPVSIDVPTDTARTLAFQCGMGMYKSKVVIN